MKVENGFVVMDKEEFLTNSLFTGLACQLLAQLSKQEVSGWMEYLSDKADEQYQQMTSSQREEMINTYVKMSQ